MSKRSVKAEATYEASGKRPGKPVSTRISDAQMERLDLVRGDESRAAFVQRTLLAAIGWNAKPAARRRR